MNLHKSLRSLIASAVGVTVKIPAAYDIAGSYETVADWSKVYPKPKIVIHKATEGTYYSDPKLYNDFAGMLENGIKRGCYHFHRRAYGAVAQAQYFCNFVRATLKPSDKIVLDVEEGGETPGQIIAWLDEVERQFPNNEIIIYSRKNLLDPLTAQCTAAQLTRLKKYRLWVAGYPLYPDLYDSIPAGYVPANLGKVIMWQYSEDGIIDGITGKVDLDWLDSAFAAELGEVPQSDVTTTPHPGMIHVTGARNGWKFHLFHVDPAYFDFELVSTPNLETVPSVYNRKHPVLATNAGEWNDRDPSNTATYLKPENYTVSNGKLIQYRLEPVPSLMITDTKEIIIDHKVQTENIRQAFSGLRYIVGPLADSSGWSTEGHARACFGVNIDGHIVIMFSEGKYPNQGLTLLDCRALMQQYGAVTAFDGGGGGDAGGVLDGVDLIKPENIVNGVNVYRALPMTFCLYAKGATMDGIAKEKLGNSAKVRKTPSRYGVEVPPALAPYAQVNFTKKVDTIPQGTADKAGEMWLQLTDGNFVNYRLYNSAGMLTDMFSIIQEPSVTPPPSVTIDSLTIEPAPGTVFTWLYSDGTTKKETV